MNNFLKTLTVITLSFLIVGGVSAVSLGHGLGNIFGDATNYAEFKADGELNLNGTAKVKKVIFVDLSKMKLGVGNPPADGLIDGFPTLDFDDTTDEETYSSFFGPLDWAAGTDAEFHIGFLVDTAPATAKNVVWGVEYKSIASDGIFGFNGETTVTSTVAVTTGTPANDKKIHNAIITIPSAGLVEEGVLLMRLYRDANNGSDTFVGDARLFDMHIHYIADKLGEAT